MERVGKALRLVDGTPFTFAPPGGQRQNSLLVDTIELFGPRHTPNAYILHLLDPANGVAIHERGYFQHLGIPEVALALQPDIILYEEEKQLLFLIDIITDHGFISLQRKYQLERIFGGCSVRRTYLSVFYDREDYKRAVEHLAWGIYIWMAHTPEHIIFHW